MSFWNAVNAIWRRELAGYFATPVAYVFIVIFLLAIGSFTFYFGQFFLTGQADLSVFFGFHPWVYLFLLPAISMRLWAEESRAGTIELLMTLPVPVMAAVLGKFIAAWLFAGIALALTFPVWITVNWLGSPDNGVIFAGYVGSLMLAGSYLAISCMTSAMTRNQVISFIVSVMLCLFLILAGFTPVTDLLVRWANPAVVQTIASFSVMTHFESFQRGVIDLRDVMFFASLMGFALFTTGVVIRGHRAG